MDEKLVAWARAVKSARRLGPGPGCRPVLWLFTDAARLADPRAAVARLPKGLCGVVLRHDGAADRAALGRDLARICRARRLALVVAGDARLAALLGAGVHLRGGRWFSSGAGNRAAQRCRALLTSSAHDFRELRRARLAGADLVFLSPAFPTASHPGAPALGGARWAGLARRARLPVAALGGIDGDSVRALPRHLCHGAGAIGALT
jgi:thiamine-phosphate pyrophosphorylase